jgi:hypothetical protein
MQDYSSETQEDTLMNNNALGLGDGMGEDNPSIIAIPLEMRGFRRRFDDLNEEMKRKRNLSRKARSQKVVSDKMKHLDSTDNTENIILKEK